MSEISIVKFNKELPIPDKTEGFFEKMCKYFIYYRRRISSKVNSKISKKEYNFDINNYEEFKEFVRYIKGKKFEANAILNEKTGSLEIPSKSNLE